MILSWIESFYGFLNGMGFPDPPHAALVHMPIGLVMGAFVLGWVGRITGRERLFLSACDCAILALVFWFPTVLMGLTDWLHFFRGSWMVPIKMKLSLAGGLLVLLAGSTFLAFRRDAASRRIVPILYSLCLVVAVGLGWFGARLVFDGKSGAAVTAAEPKASASQAAGERIFLANCRGCHPGGGNVMDANRPLAGSPALKSPEAFLSQIRHPRDQMPAFPAASIADEDAKALYLYVAGAFGPPGRKS